MKYVHRELEQQLAQAARHFPAVVLTGPRRAGKTMLLRRAFPKAGYFLLEEPDVVARFRADPHGFLDEVKTPVILDEVQQVPEVFAFVRARIDRQPLKRKRPKATPVAQSLLHREPKAGSPTHAVAPGVRALPWRRFLEEL